eukprot:Opistho-2@76946
MPMAAPVTAAITGLSQPTKACMNWNTGAFSSERGRLMKSSMSLPEVKMPGWPVIRRARTSPAAAAALIASAMLWYMAAVSAFFFSGRAISMVATPLTIAVLMLMRMSPLLFDQLLPVIGEVHQMCALVRLTTEHTIREMRGERALVGAEGIHGVEQALHRKLQALLGIECRRTRDGLVQRMRHRAARIEEGKGGRAQGRLEPGRLGLGEALDRELDALRGVLEHLRQGPGALQLGLLEQQLQHGLAGVAPGGKALKFAGATGERGRRRQQHPGLEKLPALHAHRRSMMPAAPWPAPTHTHVL